MFSEVEYEDKAISKTTVWM